MLTLLSGPFSLNSLLCELVAEPWELTPLTQMSEVTLRWTRNATLMAVVNQCQSEVVLKA